MAGIGDFFKRLFGSAKEVASEAAEKADAAMDKVGDVAGDVVDKAQDFAGDAVDKVKEVAGEAKDKVEDMVGGADDAAEAAADAAGDAAGDAVDAASDAAGATLSDRGASAVSSDMLATVDMHLRSGNVTGLRRAQEIDDAGHLLRCAKPSQRNLLGHLFCSR